MRLRNIPSARPELENSKFVFVETELKKGEWKNVFKKEAPIHLEIGTGKGRFINEMAAIHKDINFLGIEKYSSVLVKAARKLEETPLDNLRLIRMDAVYIEDAFDRGEIDKIYLNFSDPWPKDRYAKRRLTSDRFLNRYENIILPEKEIEFKTDNEELFEWSVESIRNKGWEITYLTHDLYSDDKEMEGNVATEYEIKFRAVGNKIHKLKALYRS